MEETARKKSDIERMLVCGAWCIFFVLRFWGAAVFAQEREENCESETLVLTATFCYQDEETEEITLRAGRDFALRLKVTARTEEFCGYVNVLMQNEGGEHVLYKQRIETILPGESISCQMDLPMNLMTGGLYLTLEDEAGEVLLEQTIPIETVNYGPYEMTAFFDPAQAEREENVYAHFSSYGNRLVEISESEMACGAQGMDALEIIVTQEAVLKELEERAEGDAADERTEEQRQEAERAAESLKEWVAGGKTLVVGASAKPEAEEEMLNFGLQEKEILQEVVLRVGNYEAVRESVLTTNAEIKKQYGENARTSYIGDSMLGGASVNSLSNKAVSLPIKREQTGQYWWNSDVSYEILWQERGADILRCYHVGQGNVLVFAVPITTGSTAPYPLFYYRMAELVSDNLTPMQIYRQNMEMYGDTGDYLSYLLPDIRGGNSGISVFPYVLILLFYILVLIPAVFWLLYRFERMKYLWGVLPLLSFAVMGVVYLTGARTRITEPYCTYIDITDYSAGKQTVHFSLSAPTNKGTEIMLRAGTAVRMTENAEIGFRAYEAGLLDDYVPQENILRAREYRAAVCALKEGTKLCLDNIRAFSNTSFYAWADAAPAEGELAGRITSVGSVVDGIIQNTTGLAFREVYVCSSDFAVRAGNIAPGGEVLLKDCRQAVFGEDSDSVFGSEFYWLLLDGAGGRDYSKTYTLSYLIRNYIQENPGKTYIFALPQKEKDRLLGETAQNPGSSGMQVFIWAVQEEP